MDVDAIPGTDDMESHAPGGRVPMPSDVLAALPSRVAVAYATFGATWIIVSDLAVGAAGDVGLSERLPDIAKGLLFVTSTAAVLWVVLHRVTSRFDRMFLQTLTTQRDFYGSVLSTSSDIVAIFDSDGCAVWVNAATTDLLGWRPEEVLRRPVAELLHPSDRAAAGGFLESVHAGDPGSRTFPLRHRDGSYRAIEVRGAPIRLAGGDLGVVINGRDVSDRDRSERQLRAALAEEVTGLPNLRMFMAEVELIDDMRPEGLVATVAVVDVERFRDVNDLHGREGGDLVLRELANRLESIVPEALGVWRHGADEFVLLVLEDRDGDVSGPQALAERLRGAAAAPVALDDAGTRVAVELSVGVARVDLAIPVDGEPLSALLLRSGEAALADAKLHPDRVAVRLERAAGRGGARAQVVADLHAALERGELVVHYQPKVRLDDLRVGGVEALVRWQHPTRGLLPPVAFLGAIAEANLGASLLRVVLQQALRQAASWTAMPACDPGFAVSVNVSADDLRRRRFADDVFGALAESGVAPGRLCLELTEQTMLADPVAAREVVDRLRAAGIQVAIDDFGTGYSTLEHIRVFQVDEIKIDKGFVQRLGSSPADEAIVDSVLAITQRIGVRVVAEGIERPEALEYLRSRGCAQGQGYLFGRPVEAAELDPCRTFTPAT